MYKKLMETMSILCPPRMPLINKPKRSKNSFKHTGIKSPPTRNKLPPLVVNRQLPKPKRWRVASQEVGADHIKSFNLASIKVKRSGLKRQKGISYKPKVKSPRRMRL